MISPGVGDADDLGDLVDEGIEGIQSDPASNGLPADADVQVRSEPEDGTLDGDDSVDYGLSTKLAKGPLEQRQVVAIHEGDAYILTLTAGEDQLDAASPVLDEVVDSWSWK